MKWIKHTNLIFMTLIGIGGILQLTVFAAPLETDTVAHAVPEVHAAEESTLEATEADMSDAVRVVPFYSQIDDITPADWKGVSCGIAAIAMLIDYYGPSVDPDILLERGRRAGSFDNNAGWSHAGLIALAQDYGLDGETVTLYHLSLDDALLELERVVEEGPVMVSVHYTFVPTNPIPHLVVVNDITDGVVHYNDPAEDGPGGTISTEDFGAGWKQRYISIRPVK